MVVQLPIQCIESEVVQRFKRGTTRMVRAVFSELEDFLWRV